MTCCEHDGHEVLVRRTPWGDYAAYCPKCDLTLDGRNPEQAKARLHLEAHFLEEEFALDSKAGH